MANLTYWQLVGLCFWFFLAKMIIHVIFKIIAIILDVLLGTDKDRERAKAIMAECRKSKSRVIGFQSTTNETKES